MERLLIFALGVVAGELLFILLQKLRKNRNTQKRKLSTGLERLNAKKQAKRQAAKEHILRYLKRNKQAANRNVKRILKVSEATASNYLQELEKEGKIVQVGKRGRKVFYTLS